MKEKTANIKIRVYDVGCSCDSGHEFYGSGCRMICSCVKDVKIKNLKSSHGIILSKQFNELSEKTQKRARKLTK